MSAALVADAPTPPAYRVEVSEPLLATHNGLVGESARPQALTRSGSWRLAMPAWSETWLIWVMRGAGPSCADAGTATARTSSTAEPMARPRHDARTCDRLIMFPP